MQEFEVYISSLQDSAFIVKAESEDRAVIDTIRHCKDKYPGMFCSKAYLNKEFGSLAYDLFFCSTNQVYLLDVNFPIVRPVEWV